MKRFKYLCLFLAFSIPALAVEGDRVIYAGGTAPGIRDGMAGRLNTTSDEALIFESPIGNLAIPYLRIDSYEYSTEVARHLGVMPAIAVGLVKMRRHRHYFRISYRDQNDIPQVALFEVSKQIPRALQAVLQARVQHHRDGAALNRQCKAPAR